MSLLQNENPVAKKFISSLVKNLQAVCHGNFDFDDNVKVVGHLYLTVDSNTEFNYIVNEKVSKSDESSTVFVSNSYYSVDPKALQKSLKKEPSSVACEEEERASIKNATVNSSLLNARRRSMPSPSSPRSPKQPRIFSFMRHPINLASGAPRRMPTPLPQRLPDPSSVTSPSISSESKTDITPSSSIPPESVSATPAQSLPGADNNAYFVSGFESPLKKLSFSPDNSEETLVKSTGNVKREIIEIDLTNIKEETISQDDFEMEAESSFKDGESLQRYQDQDEETNHEEFFSNLREQALTAHQVSLHANQLNFSTSQQSGAGEGKTLFQAQPSVGGNKMNSYDDEYEEFTADKDGEMGRILADFGQLEENSRNNELGENPCMDSVLVENVEQGEYWKIKKLTTAPSERAEKSPQESANAIPEELFNNTLVPGQIRESICGQIGVDPQISDDLLSVPSVSVKIDSSRIPEDILSDSGVAGEIGDGARISEDLLSDSCVSVGNPEISEDLLSDSGVAVGIGNVSEIPDNLLSDPGSGISKDMLSGSGDPEMSEEILSLPGISEEIITSVPEINSDLSQNILSNSPGSLAESEIPETILDIPEDILSCSDIPETILPDSESILSTSYISDNLEVHPENSQSVDNVYSQISQIAEHVEIGAEDSKSSRRVKKSEEEKRCYWRKKQQESREKRKERNSSVPKVPKTKTKLVKKVVDQSKRREYWKMKQNESRARRAIKAPGNKIVFDTSLDLEINKVLNGKSFQQILLEKQVLYKTKDQIVQTNYHLHSDYLPLQPKNESDVSKENGEIKKDTFRNSALESSEYEIIPAESSKIGNISINTEVEIIDGGKSPLEFSELGIVLPEAEKNKQLDRNVVNLATPKQHFIIIQPDTQPVFNLKNEKNNKNR